MIHYNTWWNHSIDHWELRVHSWPCGTSWWCSSTRRGEICWVASSWSIPLSMSTNISRSVRIAPNWWGGSGTWINNNNNNKGQGYLQSGEWIKNPPGEVCVCFMNMPQIRIHVKFVLLWMMKKQTNIWSWSQSSDSLSLRGKERGPFKPTRCLWESNIWIIYILNGGLCVIYSLPEHLLPPSSRQMSSCCLLLGQTLVTRGLTLRERWAGGSSFQPPPLQQWSVVLSFHKGWRQSFVATVSATAFTLLTVLPIPCGTT